MTRTDVRPSTGLLPFPDGDPRDEPDDGGLLAGVPLSIPSGLRGIQRSFDDLGAPLHGVTFCVIDFETTGASPTDCRITEVGAVKLRGGECLGTLQTIVNPGQEIPPAITVLTGITEAMVYPAPRIEAVLPSLLEFIGDAVIVGHNVRFDLSFLGAACERAGYARPANLSVDTCALARRLVRDEVPNCKLGTLASRLRLSHTPNHRALDDALATGELLHLLLERAAGLGVMGLDDLLTLPKMGGHEQAAKLRLTTALPRSPGVYAFRDRAGRVLYVGKATNLRSRVRSYFSGDTRRKVGQLLRETQRIDHVVCASPLEAAVREIRLIHRYQPRFNRRSKSWDRYAYLKLTLHEPFPRLSVVRTARDDGDLYLGPLPSTSFAKRVAEAIESVVPLRRCTVRLNGRGPVRDAPCAAAQLGVATCPCAGGISQQEYRLLVARVVRSITCDPELLLAPLRRRMEDLAATERFEEAADVRDRARALSQALRRQRRYDTLRRAGRLVIALDHGGAIFDEGRLVRAWSGDQLVLELEDQGTGRSTAEREGDTGAGPADAGDLMADPLPVTSQLGLAAGWVVADAGREPVPRERADELLVVAAHLESKAHTVRILHCDEGLSSPLPALSSFEPRARHPIPAKERTM